MFKTINSERIELTEAEYQQHLNDMASIETPVPQRISLRQGHEYLIDNDLYQLALDTIAAIEDDKERLKAENFFYRSSYWEIDSPVLVGFATGMGIAANLPAMFIAADQL